MLFSILLYFWDKQSPTRKSVRIQEGSLCVSFITQQGRIVCLLCAVLLRPVFLSRSPRLLPTARSPMFFIAHGCCTNLNYRPTDRDILQMLLNLAGTGKTGLAGITPVRTSLWSAGLYHAVERPLFLQRPCAIKNFLRESYGHQYRGNLGDNRIAVSYSGNPHAWWSKPFHTRPTSVHDVEPCGQNFMVTTFMLRSIHATRTHHSWHCWYIGALR